MNELEKARSLGLFTESETSMRASMRLRQAAILFLSKNQTQTKQKTKKVAGASSGGDIYADAPVGI